MFIAASRLTLDDYGNEDLRRKRRELKILLEGVRRLFNVSAHEVDSFEDSEKSVLGIALVAGTEEGARAALQKVLAHIDSICFARVISEDKHVSKF